ncbi:DNA polymerase III, delta subunit [uncultured Desulfatiglans sp.]|uniref:DNA polymerase III subunit delta n=1 Tax=Uncultured Desulfatiglans sp. TaxID=1748965 RepID=A0A653ADD8_UNCDX|nr:DNA polymerase III, delta subunit [uncultured Desulfatiglans sp.]
MAEALKPETVLGELEKGRVRPVYLFYGQDDFRIEHAVRRLQEKAVAEGAADFNLHTFYGDDNDQETVGRILDTVRSYPFMSDRRLVIVKRTESLSVKELEGFLPYLEKPLPSTCLVFVSGKTNFNMVFYKSLRSMGCAVEFKNLQDREVIPWMRSLAKDLGLRLSGEACAYLQQVVGNGLRELHNEIEKLSVSHSKEQPIGVEEVKRLVVHSRAHTIFELMDSVSSRRCSEALVILNRFFDEDREAGLRITGMLHRQLRLLWQAGAIAREGGTTGQAASALRLPPFLAKKLLDQSRLWTPESLEQGLELLYQADGLTKTGSSDARSVFENLLINLCC